MLPVLLDSALRSLLLGFVVWALLKFARLCDTRTETAIWTAVLIAALSMPLLSRHVPGLVMTVPHLRAATAQSAAAFGLLTAHQVSPPGGDSWHALAWLALHGRTCLMAAYLLGFLVCAARLATGLLLTLRLYRRATPVDALWAKARNIRASAEIKSPVSLAGAILLPADHGEWSAAKRNAVLAHEEAHIARGDFFVQLAALIHCALFWFSPFAWWLQSKLAEIAETASDEAAILRLKDRASYAEILVEVSRLAQKTPLIIAMAKGSFIEQRVEHILSEAPKQNLSLPVRMLSVAVLAALALAVAGAKAVVGPLGAAAQAEAPAISSAAPPRKHAADSTPNSGARAASTRAAREVHETVEAREASNIAPDQDEHTYNPRALLDRAYTPKLNYVPASTVVHAGKVFYVRSAEKPVADVSVTYGTNRQTH
jgi:beta-lactamase regulating signal transducer with metallopeptidase domain